MKAPALIALVLLAPVAGADQPADELPMKSAAATAATAPSVPEALPDGRALLRQHVEASGGAQALQDVKNALVQGTYSIPAQGLEGTVTIAYAKPNKVLSVAEMTGIGRIEQGYDGVTGWENNVLTGPRLLQPSEVRQLAQAESNPFGMASIEDFYDTAQTLERGTFSGRPAWKVRLVADGRESIAWFDAETKLMAGMETSVSSQLGEIPAIVTLSDYRSFGKLKLATKSTQSIMNKMIEATSTIGTVELDVPPERLPSFEPPPEVKALKSGVAAEPSPRD